jgi:hypothetical protein
MKARATRDVSQKANLCASLLYAISRFVIFGFFVYCYYLATILIQNKIQNPNTGNPYNITDIVTIT